MRSNYSLLQSINLSPELTNAQDAHVASTEARAHAITAQTPQRIHTRHTLARRAHLVIRT